ncbi:MAG: hypothetical protein JWR44_369 [Hymenobacter sp.]|nr:hypothetical protein [Hymenobacter sp.]
MLYRIAEPADWQQAQETGFFASADLAAEGFIHSSEQHQILETARRYYAGRTDLMLLEWDEVALTASGVRVEREWVASREQHFAHVFGPVPLAAVRRSWPFAATEAGAFQLPQELVSQEK